MEFTCEKCGWWADVNGVCICGYSGRPTTRRDSCMAWKTSIVTNADRIRSMTDEELDGFLNEVQGDAYLVGFHARSESRFTPYGKRWLDWLKQEAKND